MHQKTGTFEGGGHTVYGIYISGDSNYQGLFGWVNGATVKNVTVAKSYIKGSIAVGGIIGDAVSASVIFCKNTGTVSGSNGTAGIAGYSAGTSRVTNCVNNGSIIGTSSSTATGGIVGYNVGTVSYCVNNGSISATGHYVGGVVAWNSLGGTVSYCVNGGNVSASEYEIGGIVGHNRSFSIRNCYNIGSVSGGSYVGGVVGHNYTSGTTAAEEYCYNAGYIKGTRCGGIEGENSAGTINASYHSGTLKGSYASGITAYMSGSAVTCCYYDKQLCPYGGIVGNDLTGSAEGRVTADMVGSSLEGLLGDTYWIYNTTGSGTYPSLKDPSGGEIDMDTSASAFVSVSPVFLNGESTSSVTKSFDVSTQNGVSWDSADDNVLRSHPAAQPSQLPPERDLRSQRPSTILK